MRIGLVGLALGYGAPAMAGAVCAVPGDFESLQDAVRECAYGVVEVDASVYLPKRDFPGVVIEADVTIVGVNGMPDLPNLVLRASRVEIDNVRFGQVYDTDPYDTTLPEGAAVSLVGGSLRLSDSKLASIEKAGIVAIGADLTLEEVDAQGYVVAPVVYVADGEFREPSSLTMIGGSYTATQAGVVHAWNTKVSITGTEFADNQAETATVLYLESAEPGELTLTDVRIQRSWSWADPLLAYGGAIVVSNVDVTMTGGEIREVDSSSIGAGITLLGTAATAADDPPTFLATDVLWKDNHADVGASGLMAQGYEVHVEGDSRFESSSGGMSSGGGGAVALDGGSATFQGTRFTGNAAFAGGAVAVKNGSVTFDQAELEGGDAYAADYGGFVYAYGSDVAFLGSRVQSANAKEYGGAVYAEVDSTVRVEGGEIVGVSAVGAGGFAYVASGSFELRDATSQATSSAYGGFLYALQAQVAVEDTTFVSSASSAGGGALHLEDAKSVVVARSMFCGGSAWTGAAVELAGRPTRGEAVLENNVFAYNQGGASFKIFPGWGFGTGAVKLRNNDFVHNGTEADVRLLEPGVDLRNLLFRGSSVAVDAQAAAASGGYNLYDDVGTQVLGGGFDNGNALEGEALFVGGPPSWCDADLRPTADSPVVDAGDPDMPAPWGEAIDIGVYEFMGDGEDTDVEDTDVDEPDDTDDELGLPAWVSGGGGCATAGGGGAGWLVAAGLAASALRRRRSPVRSVRFG